MHVGYLDPKPTQRSKKNQSEYTTLHDIFCTTVIFVIHESEIIKNFENKC